jgi:hypothetical protein
MAGRRAALIVANDRYDNAGLGRLRSPAADAAALAGVLGDPRIGGFAVETVHNQPAHVIAGRIEDFFTDGRPDDVLLLHFSCHGLKSESGELFLAATGTRPDRLASTAVAADFVQRCMRASRSRSIVLLLDCCYGGAFGTGVTVRAGGDVDVLGTFRGGGRGRAVITASSAMEYAFEGDRLADDHTPEPSVFTSALVDGLATGEADRDEDGWVSLNELYDYVFDRVRERNAHQTPSRDVEMQGELYVARSGRRRVRPQPIPADLRAAMQDGNMFTRMGAVTELRARLASADEGVAAGAAEALREIAGSDIRYVADAAASALDAAPAGTEREPGPAPPQAPVDPAPPAPAPAPPDRRHAAVVLAAGVLGVLLGALLFGVQGEDTRVRVAEVHLGLYAAFWLWQAFGSGEWRGARRLQPIGLAVLTLGTLGWMIAAGWSYMQEYALDGTPLTWFWLAAGLLAVAVTVGSRSAAVTADRLAGAVTAAFGVVVLHVTERDSDTAFAVGYGYFVVVLGLAWVGAGLDRLREPVRPR